MKYSAAIAFYIVLSMISVGISMQTTQVTEEKKDVNSYINNQENHTENTYEELIDSVTDSTESIEPACSEPSQQTSDDGFRFNRNISLSEKLQHHIYTTAINAGVDYELILALIWNESECKTDVIGYNRNGTYDTGLMCIKSSLGWSKKELLDPYKNVEIGVSMIAAKIKKYGEYHGLMAYNLGDTGMKNAVRNGKTNNWYANKILKTKKLLETKGVLY